VPRVGTEQSEVQGRAGVQCRLAYSNGARGIADNVLNFFVGGRGHGNLASGIKVSAVRVKDGERAAYLQAWIRKVRVEANGVHLYAKK
jgi:hypothetical protein